MRSDWKVPIGMPDWVRVHPDGRVFCMRHSREKKNGRAQNTKPNWPVPKLSNGYVVVSFRIDGRMRNFFVHRLVLMAHTCPPIGWQKLDVNHKNGIRTYNRLENIEWCTRSENHLHAYRVLGRKNPMKGKKPWNIGVRIPKQFVAVVAISLDGTKTIDFPSLRDAVIAGFDSSSISHVLSGKQKSHRGYRWARS